MADALSIQGLHKVYGNGHVALSGIDLEVKQGDFFALLGPNGAGKSTTIGIISSLVNKSQGQVTIFGHNIDTDWPAAKACIGVVPQEFNFSIFEKVQDIVVNQAGYFGLPRKIAKERAEYYLKAVDLWDKKDTIAQRLSGGMKRRLMIARALIHNPKLLILDEPTAGVDIEIRRSMWAFLRKINAEGTTIILTTHYLEEAENLCKHIAIINDGLIVENTDMRSLLGRMQSHTFILELSKPIQNAPSFPDISCHLVDESTLEVVIPKSLTLNQLFLELNQTGLEVAGLRNKTNRLEELFLSLTRAKQDRA